MWEISAFSVKLYTVTAILGCISGPDKEMHKQIQVCEYVSTMC